MDKNHAPVELGRLCHCLRGFYTSQVVQDFFHQQCHINFVLRRYGT